MLCMDNLIPQKPRSRAGDLLPITSCDSGKFLAFPSLEDDQHVLITSYHSTAIMSDVPVTAAHPAARSKPLIGDGSGRYRILIIGNSGTLLPRVHTRE